MRWSLLLTLVLTGALSGCGDEDAGSAAEPTYRLVALLSGTAAGSPDTGGTVALDDPEAVEEFVAEYRDHELADQVRGAAAAVPEGQPVWGSVVALGCDVPQDVTIAGNGQPDIAPVFGKTRHVECFAAVTTVAIVTAD